MSAARKPAAAASATDPAEAEAKAAEEAAAQIAAEADADAAEAARQKVLEEKDAEIAKLREEAAASQRLLDAVKAGAPAPTEDAEAEEAEALEGDLVIEMLISITGLRDGEPWPAVGGTITLPAAEAAQYIANGYAVLAE